MGWKTLDDMDLDGKIVLTRVDINVPMDNGKVTDDTRIQRIVPTIRDILARGGTPVMLAHFGRPKGQPVPEMSLRQVVPALEAALGQAVTFVERPSREALDDLAPGTIVLVENTRFSEMEEKNDPKMAQFLASLGDVYCNDAFSAAHRAHASTEGVARLLPACAGRLMQAELSALEKALGQPERPVVAVVGGVFYDLRRRARGGGGVDGERRDIADDEFGVRDARGVDGDGDDASFGFGEDAVADAQV